MEMWYFVFGDRVVVAEPQDRDKYRVATWYRHKENGRIGKYRMLSNIELLGVIRGNMFHMLHHISTEAREWSSSHDISPNCTCCTY